MSGLFERCRVDERVDGSIDDVVPGQKQEEENAMCEQHDVECQRCELHAATKVATALNTGAR